MSRSWSLDRIFKTIAILILLVAVFIILLGGALNNIQVKYSRYRDAGKCAHGLFVLEIENSEFCCDEHYHETDWACMAAYDRVNLVFSSVLAWVVPLLPFLCTVATDAWSHHRSTEASQSSATSSKGDVPPRSHLIGVHTRRVVLYFMLFIFRTVVLYRAGGVLETLLQSDGADASCWYSSLPGVSGCKQSFDYSDHLVLLLAHFVTVAGLEATYVIYVSNLQPLREYWATMLCAVAVTGLAGRTLLFTGMFFHTYQENFLALGVFAVFVLLPLSLSSGSRLFRSAFC